MSGESVSLCPDCNTNPLRGREKRCHWCREERRRPHTREEHNFKLQRACYEELNSLPEFRNALAALPNEIGFCPTGRASMDPPPMAWTPLERFVAQWGLPESDGVRHVWR